MKKDKDDRPLQVGSEIAIQKPGKTNFTVRGTVMSLEDDILWFREHRRGFIRPAKYKNVKRVKYRPREERRR